MITLYLMSFKKSQIVLIEPESHNPPLAVLSRLSSIRFLALRFYQKKLDDHNDVLSQKNHITKLLQSIPKEQYTKTFVK